MYGIGRLAGRDEGREHGGRSRSASDVNGGAAGGTGVMPFAILSNRLRGSSLLSLVWREDKMWLAIGVMSKCDQ